MEKYTQLVVITRKEVSVVKEIGAGIGKGKMANGGVKNQMLLLRQKKFIKNIDY